MLLSIVILGLALAISIFNRSVFNPVSITLATLSLAAGLASLKLYGLYDFDPIAMGIVGVGSLAIFLGAFLIIITNNASQPIGKDLGKEDGYVCYRRSRVALAGSIVLMFFTRWSQLKILLGGGTLADVRNTYLGYGENQAVVSFIDRLFVGPVITIALPVFLWGTLRRKTDNVFVVLFLLALGLNQVTTGGRFIFLYAGVMVLALLSHAGSLHVRTARARILLVFLCIMIAVVTLARGNTLLFEAYTYLAIPIPLLSHWVSFINESGAQTFGAGFFYGGLTLFYRLSEIIGMPAGSDISTLIALPQNSWIELLPGRAFNAFVTMFYYFFLDFRWVGVTVGGFIWGCLGQWSYKKMWNSSLRATIFGLLMLQVATMAFVRWEFTNGSLVIALLMLPIFVKGNTISRNSDRKQPYRGVVV